MKEVSCIAVFHNVTTNPRVSPLAAGTALKDAKTSAAPHRAAEGMISWLMIAFVFEIAPSNHTMPRRRESSIGGAPPPQRNTMRHELAVLGLALMIGGGAGAQVTDDLSCSHFSTDPNDRAGPPIRFRAELWDGPQRKPTTSPAVGEALFTLERDTLRLTWTVTFKDLTSAPTELHAHGPTPAEGLAPELFSLAPDGFSQPIRGERVVSLGEASYFVQNSIYVNLHTTKYPEGEIRGTVKKLRPKC
jgi:hypothetical protein